MSFDSSFLNQITPERIEQYLVSKGWKLHRFQPPEARTPRSRLYNSPKIKYAQIEVPLEMGVYYSQSIYNIIQYLSELEKRDGKYVYEDLQFYDCEIIRYRLISSQTNSGTIPIGIGSDCLEAIVELLQSSLNDVAYSSLKGKAKGIRENVLLDQTERGSYIVKVVCPLHAIPFNMLPLDGNSDTVIRRTTKHMMRTASDIVSAIDGNKIGKFIDSIVRKLHPASPKSCNILSKIQISDDGEVDLNVRWASALGMKDTIPDSVRILPKHFDGISEIVYALNSKSDNSSIPQKEKFIAVVEECKGDYNSEGVREGNVILNIFSTDGKTSKAQAFLLHPQYKIAHENHVKDKGSFLEIVGKRIMKGRLDEIVDIEKISPLYKQDSLEDNQQVNRKLLSNVKNKPF